jgi:hypothetical protein
MTLGSQKNACLIGAMEFDAEGVGTFSIFSIDQIN